MLAKRELQVIEFIPKYIDFGGKKLEKRKRENNQISRGDKRGIDKSRPRRVSKDNLCGKLKSA